MENFNKNDYHYQPGTHKGKNVIWVKFEYNPAKISALKAATAARWSQTHKTWYVPDNAHYRALLDLPPVIVGKEVMAHIRPVNLPAFSRFQEQVLLKGYSPNTLRTYSIEFAQLLFILKDFHVDQLTPERLRSYFLYCCTKKKLSETALNSRINAIKFYFEQVLHRQKMFFDIPRPKKPFTLPKTLSQNEIAKLFEVSDNLKHTLILKLGYGMGLRVSEIVALKTTDIDWHTKIVRIERGKGKKDRIMPLPKSVIKELSTYIEKYRPKNFLFEGQYGSQYSARSAQAVFKTAMKKGGIDKRIGIHGLRHSYATHLMEQGTEAVFIKKLMGHKDIKTTLLYTHIADKNILAVKSPLDQL